MAKEYDTNYKFKSEYCFCKNSEEDRYSKQLGNFGEQLIITLLGRMKKYKVAYVDHEGADLIASAKEDNQKGEYIQYAISVKSRQFGYNNKTKEMESNTYKFEYRDQEKLAKYAHDFGMIPVVAFVFISADFSFIDVYMIKLEDLIGYANGAEFFKEKNQITNDKSHKYPELAINRGKKGDPNIHINTYHFDNSSREYIDSAYQDFLQNNEDIQHIRLDVNGRLNFNSFGIEKTSVTNNIAENTNDGSAYSTIQFGSYGEHIIEYIVGKLDGYRVSIVDHVGVDIIASNPENMKKYGISVKSSHDRYKEYEKDDISKIIDFCLSFHMEPMVAYVFVDINEGIIDTYILSVYTLISESLENKNVKAVWETENKKCPFTLSEIKHSFYEEKYAQIINKLKSITFKNEDKGYLKNHNSIEYRRFLFDSQISNEKSAWNSL